jgi:hypothetical protein
MPDRPPLVTPSGASCVWYRRSSQSGSNEPGSYSASDTVQPFLLADESGQCIVLPAGADITGGQTHSSFGGNERLIAPGDTIYVTGELRPATAAEREAGGPSSAAFVVCDPADRSPFVISANPDGSSEASWYGLLAAANLVLVVASAALLGYVLWAARQAG